MLEEAWKPIVGFESEYQVSNLGRVRSVGRIIPTRGYTRTERIRKPFVSGGYEQLELNKDRFHKNYSVHRLVAEAFIPNPENKPCVNHIDGNKLNNCVDNLEWCTYSENTQHAIKHGLINTEQSKINGRKSVDVVGIRVQCLDTGEVFACVSDAVRRIDMPNLQSTIHSNTRTHSGRGWLFKKLTEDEYQLLKDKPVDIEHANKIHKEIQNRVRQTGRPIKVQCVETGKIYSSRNKAAKDNNMDPDTIRLAVNEGRKAKGLTFRYIDTEVVECQEKS